MKLSKDVSRGGTWLKTSVLTNRLHGCPIAEGLTRQIKEEHLVELRIIVVLWLEILREQKKEPAYSAGSTLY